MAHLSKPFKDRNAVTIASIVIASLSLSASGFYAVSVYLDHQSKIEVARQSDRPPVPKTITADGRLEPLGKKVLLSVPFGMESARVQRLNVKEGDLVLTGAIIAVLDSYSVMKANLDNALAREKIALARLKRIKSGAKKGEIEAQRSRVFENRAERYGQISTQQANIADLTARLQGETRMQRAAIQRLEDELTNKSRDCDRYTSLFKEEAVSASLQESTCLERNTARERLEEARASIERTRSTLSAQIDAARENLKRTIATLDHQVKESEATLAAVAEVRTEDVTVAETELTAATSAVKQALANLELTLVRSPIDARILKIHTEPGEIAREGIANIGVTRTMAAVAEVYETDIQHVRIGQKAIVTSSALATPLHGRVSQIGLQVERKDVLNDNPVVAADARIVEVRIELDDASSKAAATLTDLKVDVTIDR
jgi:HlyD family secretion protein